ncbi:MULTISPECIES: hypothetical protein [unclassified Knoellia]|uniref:hypothetical protein n=1 Tax=Knoellia altitudinis TaxID=3404795 RepID=UPI00360D63B5
MRDVSSTGQGPSRRLVTAGAVGVAVTALAGCGIRLEDDAPRVPLVPTRSPIEGEDALLRLLAAVQAAAVAPADPKQRISPLLAPLHQRQARVLHDALRQRGVPEDQLSLPSTPPSASTSAGPSTSSSPSPSPSTAPATLVAVERSVVTAGAGCALAEVELRPTLLALLGQAHAALEIATLEPDPAPDVPAVWSTPAALAPLVTALRSATYLLEVAAARSPQPARRAGLEGIGRLGRLTAELVTATGDAAPAPELGRALPRRVTTPAEAASLAKEAMTTLLATFGSALAPLSERDADSAFTAVPRWLGTVAAQTHRHGVPLAPFPGLA